jgi:hypothetical protein
VIVDLRSRRSRVVVGGQDLSSEFDELIVSDDYIAETGLVTTKGALKVSQTWGGPGLDDWQGLDWLKLGSKITVDIDLGAGWQRHPRGTLYIQGTAYKLGTNQLEVACVLGARKFAEPIDETKVPGSPTYGTPGYVRPTHSTTAQAVVNRLFQLAGCGLPVWSTSQNFNLCDRPQLTGSYIESAGKILASLGLFAVADGFGVVQIYPVEAAAILFTTSEAELSDMERVLVGQPPAGVAVVSGSYRICHDRGLTVQTIAQTRGDIGAIVQGAAGFGTVSRTIITETIDPENSLVSRQQVEDRLGFQVYKGRSGLPRTGLVSSSRETGFKQYSQGPDAKLLYSQSATSSPAAVALQAYCDWAIANKKPAPLSTDVVAQREQVTYTYDAREQLIEIVRLVWSPIGTILAGLGGVEWQKIYDAYGLPDEPILSEREITQWQLVAPGEWRKVSIKEYSQCKDSNGQAGLQERLAKAKDSELMGIYRQAAACSASTVQVEESNSGQANPPAAERFPAATKTEDRQVDVKVTFQGFANTWDPRVKAYTCPHLPDVHGSETVNDFAHAYGAVWHMVALRRWQSVRIEMPFRSELLSYRPYAHIEVATATGTYRLALNGTSWAISPEKALVSSDCSLVGLVPAPGVVVPPFTATPELSLNLGFQFGLELADYEPAAVSLQLNLGLKLPLNQADVLSLRLGLALPLRVEDDNRLVLRLGLQLGLQKIGLSNWSYSSAPASLLGTSGLTQIVSTSADDANVALPDIGFDFPLYDGIYRTNIYIGSNSYLTFGFGSNQYNSISASSPGRGLLVGAGDRSWNQVWAGSDDLGTYRVRWQGNTGTSGAGGVVWEATLFDDGVLLLVTGAYVQVSGYAALTKGSSPIVETPYGLTPLRSWVFQPDGAGSYTVQEGSYS